MRQYVEEVRPWNFKYRRVAGYTRRRKSSIGFRGSIIVFVATLGSKSSILLPPQLIE